MSRINITEFGKGLDTTSNPTLIPKGYARQSQNFLHNLGTNRCKVRRACNRVYATRTGTTPVFSLYEFINAAGTQTNLCQVNGALESFSLTPATAKTSIDTGHQTTLIPRFTQALNFYLEADGRDNNYIGNASAAYPFQIAAPAIAFIATAVADATAATWGSGILAVGAYNYDYARYSSTTGEISPARGTAVSVTTTSGNQRVTLNASTIATTEQFDQIRIYRTKVGGTQYYEVQDITPTQFDNGVTDGFADASLTVVSTIHTSAGASNTTRPEAATDVVFYRGRVHFVGLAGFRSRHRWSQFNAYQFNSTTDARHDVDADDGDFLQRAVSYEGYLVLFKEHSIHVMTGDVSETTFTWQVASPKEMAIGAYCPHTVVATPIGIIFQSEMGVYSFRPGGLPLRISDTIHTTLEGLDYSRRNLFTAEFCPRRRAYILSITNSGATTNNITLAYYVDTGFWSELEHNIRPSSYGKFHNSSGELKLYFGDTNGYVYETETTNGADGVTSGTVTGTATGGSSTSVSDTGAAFRTTGNGLLGLFATVQSSAGAFESQEISSNTATALTTAAWTTTPASGNTYYVGAIDAILSLSREDGGSAGNKRFTRLTFEFQRQTHSIPLLVGFTIDADTEPTTTESVLQSGGSRVSIPVNRIGVGLAPYLRCVGTVYDLEILRIEIDYVDMPARTRQ